MKNASFGVCDFLFMFAKPIKLFAMKSRSILKSIFLLLSFFVFGCSSSKEVSHSEDLKNTIVKDIVEKPLLWNKVNVTDDFGDVIKDKFAYRGVFKGDVSTGNSVKELVANIVIQDSTTIIEFSSGGYIIPIKNNQFFNVRIKKGDEKSKVEFFSFRNNSSEMEGKMSSLLMEEGDELNMSINFTYISNGYTLGNLLINTHDLRKCMSNL